MRRPYFVASAVGLIGIVGFSMGWVPAVANQMNRQAVQWIAEGKPYPARLIFEYLEFLGNGEAANNLGVVYLRGIGVKRDRERAIALFETAVSKSVAQGRYNLVLTMPNRSKTPKNIIQRQLDLLALNIEAGDVPSHVLAAERLYYLNRQEFIPDRQARKLAMLEVAARTNDPDYLYQYGKELEVQAFKRNDAEMMISALRAYRRAFDNGNMRGAEALGSARQIRDWDVQPSRADVLEKSEAEWTLIAAEAGSITAKCRHGNRRFRWMNELSGKLSEPLELQKRVDRYLAQENPFAWKTSVAFLQQCARAKKLSFPPNPPFGDIALYGRKRRGSVTALVNSPEWASYHLAQLYTLGLHVERDVGNALHLRSDFPDRAALEAARSRGISWRKPGQRPEQRPGQSQRTLRGGGTTFRTVSR